MEDKSPAQRFREYAAARNANRHLRAYAFTRNPRHILDAMTEFVRDSIPFLVALLAIVLFVAFVPQTVLFLANRY